MSRATVVNADCRDVLRGLADSSVDAVVTDPPYEIGFMARGWDSAGVAFDVELWRDVLRVLKPGGFLLAFGATRTFHRMAVAVEDAGFELRDVIAWIRGGPVMPKGLDVSKALDKAAGARGHEAGNMRVDDGTGTASYRAHNVKNYQRPPPVTDDAKRWLGWHTALKPLVEPVVVARKPLAGTIVDNVRTHGVGALNVGACRIGSDVRVNPPAANKPGGVSTNMSARGMPTNAAPTVAVGRWPPNVVFSHALECEPDKCAEGCPVVELDQQGAPVVAFPAFRYQAKASTRDRGANNPHPTVKPSALMRWLVRLVTPKNGLVLDPFTGSGTTAVACVLEGARFIGAELSSEYHATALARIKQAEQLVAGDQLDLFDDLGGDS